MTAAGGAPHHIAMTSPPEMKVQLRELAQLFNSMDPSPFHDRDLDAAAEAFIVGWARELPARGELALTIALANRPSDAKAAEVGEAVRHYFARRAEMKQRDLHKLLRQGRTSLGVGLVFLTSCLLASEVVQSISQRAFMTVLKESLMIGGWVAMWRPLEIYLYDWWPIRAERLVLERLARMEVRLEMPPAPGAPA